MKKLIPFVFSDTNHTPHAHMHPHDTHTSIAINTTHTLLHLNRLISRKPTSPEFRKHVKNPSPELCEHVKTPGTCLQNSGSELKTPGTCLQTRFAKLLAHNPCHMLQSYILSDNFPKHLHLFSLSPLPLRERAHTPAARPSPLAPRPYPFLSAATTCAQHERERQLRRLSEHLVRHHAQEDCGRQRNREQHTR